MCVRWRQRQACGRFQQGSNPATQNLHSCRSFSVVRLKWSTAVVAWVVHANFQVRSVNRIGAPNSNACPNRRKQQRLCHDRAGCLCGLSLLLDCANAQLLHSVLASTSPLHVVHFPSSSCATCPSCHAESSSVASARNPGLLSVAFLAGRTKLRSFLSTSAASAAPRRSSNALCSVPAVGNGHKPRVRGAVIHCHCIKGR